MKTITDNDLPERKKTRLDEYDYSTAGAYFVTICTHNRIRILWENTTELSVTIDHMQPAPTLSWIINQFKGVCSKQIGYSIWQRGFYDHIIRTEQDYAQIWQYIDENPLKWESDEYYKQ